MPMEIINSPFIQNIGGTPKEVHFKTSSGQVVRPDASTVEEALLALEASLSSANTALQTFETFLTGEDNDNGVLDRLSELVTAINANKSLIEGILADTNKLTGPDVSTNNNLAMFSDKTGKQLADAGIAKDDVKNAVEYSKKAWAATVAAIPDDADALAALVNRLHNGAIIVVDPSVKP